MNPDRRKAADTRGEAAAIDRAHLDEVFGDVLPDSTRDERGLDDQPASTRDDEMLRDVPPHSG